MSAQIFERFKNTTFYDSDKFSKTLWDENNGPITEENLQIPDFYVQFFRNTDVRMDIDPNKFMNTINNILSGDNELLKIRSILLLFTFKNIFDIYPYLSMIITEDKIQVSDSGYFSDCDNFLTEKSKYFTDIFYTELNKHPFLVLDVIESIHYLVDQISLQYDIIYPIINNIILLNEKSATPVHHTQLNFFDDKSITGYKQKIEEKYPLILPFKIKYQDFETANLPQKKSNIIINDIIWFWKYFMELDDEQKITVLKFVTGSSSIPTEGLDSIKIRFTRLKETDSLPSIHTCFKEILLPEYDTYDELKKKCNLTFTFL